MLGRSARCTVAALMLAFWGSHPPPAASQAPGSGGAALIGILLSTTDKWNGGDLDGFIAPYVGIATFMTPAGPIGRDAMRARYAAVLHGITAGPTASLRRVGGARARRGPRAHDWPLLAEWRWQGGADGALHAGLDAHADRVADPARSQ